MAINFENKGDISGRGRFERFLSRYFNIEAVLSGV
jgi:hypothetical protein